MIDEEDIVEGAALGGIGVAVIFLICWLIFSRPEIDKCHAKGGEIVRIEGADKCIDKNALREIPDGRK